MTPHTQHSWEKLKEEINTRLWYALGDIEPTEEKMIRAVTSMEELIRSTLAEREQTLRDKIWRLENPYLGRNGDERHDWAINAYAKALEDVLDLLSQEKQD